MPTRAEMIAALQAHDAENAPPPAPRSGTPSREEMIAALQAQDAASAGPKPEDDMGTTEKAVRAVGEFVAPVVAPVGRFVDRFTGAPVRAAIGAAQRGENPAEAYMNQFGGAPENAPTGKEIAQKAGLGETSLSDVVPSLYDKSGKGWALRKGGMLDPTASGAAGAGIDIAADPLNFVGVGEIADAAKPLARAAGKTGKFAVEGAAKTADFVTGTKAATKTLEATKKAATVTKDVGASAVDSIASVLKPNLAKDAKDMEAIAAKNGIPKELMSPAHEFGDTSSITRLQRTVAEGGLGQKYLDAHNEGLLKTSEALEKNLSSKFGQAPATAADAGQILKDAVEKHVSDVFDSADITYGNAAKKLGPIKLDDAGMGALRSKALGMKNEAMRLMRTSADPVAKSQAQNLMEWSDLILNKVEKGGSYSELADIVQNVGKSAYAKVPLGQIPSDVKKLRELYDVGSETLIQSVRNHSAEAADRLVVNNAEIKEMLGDKAKLGSLLQTAKSPEQLYNALLKNGGSEQIATLKKILPPETFNQLRGKYLRDLVKYADQDGNFVNFGSTITALQKNQDRLKYLFDASELKDAADILKFGDRYGKPIMSTSGTGGSSGFRNIKAQLTHAIVDENALEAMKSRARAAGAPAAQPAGQAAAQGAGKRPLIRDRGTQETRLKAAQSIAPQTYARPPMPAAATDESTQDVKATIPNQKGRDKWAADGLEKLAQHGGRDPASLSVLQAAMGDPEGKQMLINASDLKPGSKAMDVILKRLKEKYGAAKP